MQSCGSCCLCPVFCARLFLMPAAIPSNNYLCVHDSRSFAPRQPGEPRVKIFMLTQADLKNIIQNTKKCRHTFISNRIKFSVFGLFDMLKCSNDTCSSKDKQKDSDALCKTNEGS